MSDESELPVVAIIVFVLLLLYVVVGGFIESRKLPFGHETGVAILAGMAVSLIVWKVKSSTEQFFLFDDSFFFYVCLPPIIFTSGFNMRRKKFFKNLGYIMLFGIFGTIMTFIMFSVLTYAAFATGLMRKYDPVSK